MTALELLVRFDARDCTRADVGDWVDARIVETTAPSSALLELALLARKSSEEIASLLLELVPPEADFLGARLTHIADAYARGELAVSETLDRLSGVWQSGVGEDDRVHAIDWLIDSFALAREGTYGTVEDVERELAKYLQAFASAR